MRASTLFGLAIALFLGAGAVVVIRMTGILDRTPVTQQKFEPIKVLVAKTNIFEGTTATFQDVMVRDATREEQALVTNKNSKDKYMPAIPAAVNLRVASRNVSVGELIQKDQFLDQFIPDAIGKRLDPGMRSVNVVVPKDHAAGGLLRVGEYVDVYLTTAICTDPKCSNYRNATAPLAKGLKVIAKRDSIWTMMLADPEDKPISFILQANPYRAGLIELAKTKGSLSLIPSSQDTASKMSPALAKIEESRSAAFMSGESIVSDQDLERIFNLQPLQTPEPPLSIEHYSGVKYMGTTTHDAGDKTPRDGGGLSYSFYAPDQVGVSGTSPTGLRSPGAPTKDSRGKTTGIKANKLR